MFINCGLGGGLYMYGGVFVLGDISDLQSCKGKFRIYILGGPRFALFSVENKTCPPAGGAKKSRPPAGGQIFYLPPSMIL